MHAVEKKEGRFLYALLYRAPIMLVLPLTLFSPSLRRLDATLLYSRLCQLKIIVVLQGASLIERVAFCRRSQDEKRFNSALPKAFIVLLLA